MKALSVRQPWAELIASGRKTIELRTWRTNYRGPLVICASGQADRDWVSRYFGGTVELPRGVAVCVVELVSVRRATAFDVTRAHFLPSAEHWAWELRGVVRIDPRPVKGKLSLFEVTL